MNYLSSSSSSASVSSAYSASSGRIRFKDSQEALAAAALDNKYLKRRSQIIEDYHRRRHHLDLCGGGGGGGGGEQIFHLTNSPRNRQYLMVLLAVMVFSLSSFWFLAGWLSAYYTSPESEEKSLQNLADSIRRMRLRRHRANHKAGTSRSGVDDDALFEDDAPVNGDKQPRDDPNHPREHQYYNRKSPPEPRNEFEYPDLQGEAERVQKLEERIRETQDRQVKAELRAKRLEDSMASSIKALKDFANHEGYKVAAEDVEDESFT
jgi:hypothetical protein